jgi:sugar phosphate isomerase/epimerase
MRYAIHTISWGAQATFSDMVTDIVRAGYTGLELFQDPNSKSIGGAEKVYETLQSVGTSHFGRSVQLVGICSGTFEERLKFVKEFAKLNKVHVSDPSMPYVYFDEAMNKRVELSIKEGYRIALHPHMYTPVQTFAEADLLLMQHPRLLFLPDTAHMRIAGDDAAIAIEKYSERLAGVHMKNWNENVGRSYQFYARGFCELGEDGNVDLERVLNALLRKAPQAWLIVEQDRPANPFESAKRSRDWLRRRLDANSGSQGL